MILAPSQSMLLVENSFYLLSTKGSLQKNSEIWELFPIGLSLLSQFLNSLLKKIQNALKHITHMFQMSIFGIEL